VLVALATVSGAAIVLSLTVIVIGLQMSSRFGSRASRMLGATPVGQWLAVAALLGVAAPIWAAAGPWSWLRAVAFASFAWAILALGLGGYATLEHLSPRWLSVHIVRRLQRASDRGEVPNLTDLLSAQSILVEVAMGTAEGDPDRNAVARALAYVGLAEQRLSDRIDNTAELVESLGSWARASARQGDSPIRVAALLSLIGLASGESELGVTVLTQLSELVQDSIRERRDPVVRSLLDEAAGFVTDALQSLLKPATIPWLEDQEPIGRTEGIFVRSTPDDSDSHESKVDATRSESLDLLGWIADGSLVSRGESAIIQTLLPEKIRPRPRVRSIGTGPTLVTPDMVFGDAVLEEAGPVALIVDLADFLAGVVTPPELAGEREPTNKEWDETVSARQRHSDAYDLVEEVVRVLRSAIAAPRPDLLDWPGGWRGSAAFGDDMARLSLSALTLYESGRYPPSDKAEVALEEAALRLAQTAPSDLAGRHLPDPVGWRVGETALDRSALDRVTGTLADMAIASWRSGFARRSLLTLRRLISIFALTVQRGDTSEIENVAENVGRAIAHSTRATDSGLAERERSRQLVLSLAPEVSSLGRALEACEDGEIWRTAFNVLDGIGWSPTGSASETAAEVFLHFLAGFALGEEPPNPGQPWDVVSWHRAPVCAPNGLPVEVRERLLRELHMSAANDSPRLGLLAVMALWRDAIVSGEPDRIAELRTALQEEVLDRGRMDFALADLWTAADVGREVPPKFEGPYIHHRLFDVATAVCEWADQSRADRSGHPVLPVAATPDVTLQRLIGEFEASSMVDERDYWGVEYDEDHFVLVQEADRSRRFLRDDEARARSRITWGYSGTGPHDLASMLVADVLGPLAYCPSCFGTIEAAAGLISCPSCTHGFRTELETLASAASWITSFLCRKPAPGLVGADAPPGAQWHARRSDILAFVLKQASVFEPEDEAEVEDVDGAV
jgi:hypothetical protein